MIGVNKPPPLATAVRNQEGLQKILGLAATGLAPKLRGKTSTLGWGGGFPPECLSGFQYNQRCILGTYCVVKQSKGSHRGWFQWFREMCLYG